MADPCTFPLSAGDLSGTVGLHADETNTAFVKLDVDCPGGTSDHACQISLTDGGRVHLQANVFPGMSVTVVHNGQVHEFA